MSFVRILTSPPFITGLLAVLLALVYTLEAHTNLPQFGPLSFDHSAIVDAKVYGVAFPALLVLSGVFSISLAVLSLDRHTLVSIVCASGTFGALVITVDKVYALIYGTVLLPSFFHVVRCCDIIQRGSSECCDCQLACFSMGIEVGHETCKNRQAQQFHPGTRPLV